MKFQKPNLDQLREQFKRFEESGGKTTKAYKGGEGKQFKSSLEEDRQFRLLCFPDGDIFKEYHVVYGVDKSPVPGQKYEKDNYFLCPKKNFGESSAIHEWSQELWNSIEPPVGMKKSETTQGKEAMNMWATPRFVFTGVRLGKEDEGMKLFVTSNTVYKTIMEKIFDKKYDEDGGLLNFDGGECLALEVTAKEQFNYKITEIDVTRRPRPLFPKDSKMTIEDLLEDCPNPDELFRRVTYEETQDILQRYMERVHGISAPDMEKYGSEEDTTSLDDKFKQLKDKI